MPASIDPTVNYPRIAELAEEFSNHWDKLWALYIDGAVGFIFVRQHIEGLQEIARSYARGTDMDSEAEQDKRIFLYSEILSENVMLSDIKPAKQGEMKSRNAINGENFVTLGHSCIVSFYTFWEDYLRREYAIAKGFLSAQEKDGDKIKNILSEKVKSDVWGDLGLFRNSIVHNHGRASSKISNCKLFKWFNPGDQMLLTPEHMRLIFLRLLSYRNELFAEQFPPQYMRF